MIAIVKPTYSCNFRCKYCYLTNDTKSSSRRFNVEFAKQFIVQAKEAVLRSRHKELNLIWHGGEPLLWGIENFRRVFEFMEQELQGVQYKNSLQTNLSLMNDEYIALFLKYHVHVGFSLDGVQDINDSQRVYADGTGTFNEIMQKVKLCQEQGLNIGCIVVGSKKHIGRISELYQFLCDHHLNFKFNPLFQSGEAGNHIDEFGVTTKEYAQMTIELFDLWFFDEQHHIVESNFTEIASSFISGKTSSCMFGRNCQDNFIAISPLGDVMPCGRFCDEGLRRYAYGNLYEESLAAILKRRKTTEAYKRWEYISTSNCRQCMFFNICHGGCMHDGFLRSGDLKQRTFLCNAYKKIYTHIFNRLKETGLYNQQ
ncbi:MAG: radical SAM protein [Prevotella sp.]|nr:radical SAM protein [Prevotella sp.]